MKCTRVDSLEAESNVMPLKFRRELLGLNYLSGVFMFRDHPISRELSDYHEFDFYNIRPHPLPFYGRMLKLLGDSKESFLSMGKMLERCKFLLPDCSFNLSLAGYSKKVTSDLVYNRLFTGIESGCSDFRKVYTDGSVVDFRCGSGVLIDGVGYSYRLPDYFNIFTAELFAIKKALELAIQRGAGKFVFYVDSLSVLQALKHVKIHHYLIASIVNLINTMRGFTILFVWIPSHRNISGNVRVDELAREGTLLLNIHDVQESLVERKANIRRDCMVKWQDEWNDARGFYRNIKNHIGDWPSAYRRDRREEIVLCRMRLNVCRFAYQHFFEGTDQLSCMHCRTPITLEHLVLYCPVFHDFRSRLSNVDVLQMSSYLTDEYNHSSLFRFLKSVNYFDKI